MRRRYLATAEERQEGQRRLEKIKKTVLQEVPACKISADQPYRIADLAIDYCEDVAPLGQEDVARICQIIEQEGATYKVSSIHVNCWFGDYNKVACFKGFLEDFTGKSLSELQQHTAFIGDSPNDEPIFKEL